MAIVEDLININATFNRMLRKVLDGQQIVKKNYDDILGHIIDLEDHLCVLLCCGYNFQDVAVNRTLCASFC